MKEIFRVAVCDDEVAVCGDIERIVLDYAKRKNVRLECEVLLSGEDLIKYLKADGDIDLLFLDIELIKMNGVEAGRYIRESLHNDNMYIVFVSCRDSYYRDLFSIRPTDFIDKPISKEKIFACISTVLRLSGNSGHLFKYQKERNVCHIEVKNIIYFVANGRNVEMVTTKGRIAINMRLNKVLKELENYAFCMAHKAYLVNIAKIEHVEHGCLVMTNNDQIPLGRKYKNSLIEKI